MIFGMSTASFFLDKYTEDAINEIGKMGIKNAEVFFSSVSEYKPEFVKELNKRADDNGINIYSIHALNTQFEPQTFSMHERQRDDAYDVYKRVLEAGAVLGAQVYVFHGPTNVKIAKKLRINYEYAGLMVSKAANLAKQYGIKFSYETVHWCWYAKPDFPTKLNEHLTTDNLYFTLDLKQAGQSKYDFEDYIDAMGDRLVNVHICDFVVDEKRGIIPKLPFKGSLNFKSLKNKLYDINYNGGMILEVYTNNYKNLEELKDNYYYIEDFFTK